MRTTTLICFTFLVLAVKAQSFHPRDLVLCGGNGAGVTYFEATDTAGFYLKDQQGGLNYLFRFEYGLSPALSADFNLSLTPLISETLLDHFARCYMVEAGPGMSYHIPWNYKWIDPECGAGFNFIHYFYRNDGNEIDGGGVSLSAQFHPRFYFTRKQRLGALAYYRFSYYFMGAANHYSGIPYYETSIRGYTHSFGIGLFYRFGNGVPDNTLDPGPPNHN